MCQFFRGRKPEYQEKTLEAQTIRQLDSHGYASPVLTAWAWELSVMKENALRVCVTCSIHVLLQPLAPEKKPSLAPRSGYERIYHWIRI